MTMWRQGTNVPLNVYEGDRPVCQCHTASDAKFIVQSANFMVRLAELEKPQAKRGRPAGRKHLEPTQSLRENLDLLDDIEINREVGSK